MGVSFLAVNVPDCGILGIELSVTTDMSACGPAKRENEGVDCSG